MSFESGLQPAVADGSAQANGRASVRADIRNVGSDATTYKPLKLARRSSTLSDSPRLRPVLVRLLIACVTVAIALMLLMPPVAKAADVINVNKADLAALQTLPGIGEKRAKSIISYRKKNGGFGDKKDLLNVDGIGDKILKKISSKISVSGGSSRVKDKKKDTKKKSTSKSKDSSKDAKSSKTKKTDKKKSSDKKSSSKKSSDKKSDKSKKSKKKSSDSKKSKKKKKQKSSS